MKIIYATLFLVCVSLFFITCSNKPTESTPLETKISGKITDKDINDPISGAQVTTSPTTSSVTTDASGSYTISDVTAGQYIVSAAKSGYSSSSINVVVTEGKTASADIQLSPIKPQPSASVSSLDFGTTQSIATFILSNATGVGSFTWSASPSANWLSMSPASGTISTGTTTITVTANRSGLAIGNYSASISITSTAGNITIPVTLAIPNPNAPQLTVSPLLLDFGSSQQILTFNIQNSGTGTLMWNTSSSQNWISVSPAHDSTRTEIDQVTVNVNRNGMSPATYNGEITVTSNAGSQTVNVRMVISAVPSLSLSTNSLNFDSLQTQLAFNVSNAGAGTLNWTASGNQSWMTVNPTSGTNSGTVNVTVSRNGLSSGNYSGVVSLTSNGGNGSVGVQMKVPAESKVKVPELVTYEVSAITDSSAQCGGNITSDGGAIVTARGVCWSKTTNPTLANNKTTDSTGMGSFTSSLSRLSPATVYYVRAYATNSVGTAYGNQQSFTTSASIPTITTTAVISITSTTASSGGNINSDGGATVTARGVCWSTSTNPTIADSKTTNGTGTGNFVSSITGLSSNTTYYLRAYATNSVGTAYGNELSFKTSAGLSNLTTTEISSITSTTAISGGNITNDGGATITARGVCWSTSHNPSVLDNYTTDGSGAGSFTSNITGLSPLTNYYVRAYATNSAGTAYGNEFNFTTAGVAPPMPTNIGATPGDKEVTIKWTAVSGATSYNIYWSTNPGVSKTNFAGKITNITTTSCLHTGLVSGTTYYYVVTAKNNNGESNESSMARATPPLLLQTKSMSQTGEKHYYQVTVSSGQNLFVYINIATNVQNYYLYVKFGSLPTTSDFDVKSETGADEAISITNTQAGTYYIMVYASYFAIYNSGDYTITGSTSVTALTFGTTYVATISHSGEKHYYEVTVSSGQSLFVNVNLAATIQDFYLYVKYGSLPTTTVNDAKSETGEDEAISITNTQAGTYYIMVYASHFADYNSGDYTITAFK